VTPALTGLDVEETAAQMSFRIVFLRTAAPLIVVAYQTPVRTPRAGPNPLTPLGTQDNLVWPVDVRLRGKNDRLSHARVCENCMPLIDATHTRTQAKASEISPSKLHISR
jgi:hypothetical protein